MQSNLPSYTIKVKTTTGRYLPVVVTIGIHQTKTGLIWSNVDNAIAFMNRLTNDSYIYTIDSDEDMKNMHIEFKNNNINQVSYDYTPDDSVAVVVGI